jgi:hypothetical protein
MFEAGAISRSVDKPRLCTMLFDLEPIDVKGPLERFQHTKFLKEDIRHLLKTINSNAKEAAIKEETLDIVFERMWPDLNGNLEKIMKEAGSSPKAPVRDVPDLLAEIVGQGRVTAEQLSQIKGALAAITRQTFDDQLNKLVMARELLRRPPVAGLQVEVPSTGILGLSTVDYDRSVKEYLLNQISNVKPDSKKSSDDEPSNT